MRNGTLKPLKDIKQSGVYQHGMSHTKEHNAYRAMLARCYNPNHNRYHRYGERGITVCDEWKESFLEFFNCVGPAPTKKHSLQRIDNDGNYEPGNVRWASRVTQARSRHNNHMITYEGISLCIADWSDLLGMDPIVLCARIHAGWSTHRAFTQPVRKRRNGKPDLIPKPVSRETVLGREAA
jgi:hypothetical protein